jgi:hypothetical protein
MDRQQFRRNHLRWLTASLVALIFAAWWLQTVRAPVELPASPLSPVRLQAWLMTTPPPSAPSR